MRYAGFWRRFVAYGIDSSIVQLLAILAVALLMPEASAQTLDQALQPYIDAGLLPPPGPGQTVTDMVLMQLPGAALFDRAFLWSIAIGTIYNVLFLAGRWQATPGKHWCKLVVVHESTRPITWKMALIRHFASGISWVPFGLGYLMIAFRRDKAAMHDVICGTRVVYRDSLPGAAKSA